MSDQPSPTAYGRQIRRLRGARRWSQEQLGRRANVGHQTISDIETGRRDNPKLETLEAIARALGVEVAELVGEPAANGAA